MYSIQDLAKLAGISSRTLRYYDQIGLLVPARRTESGTRWYAKARSMIYNGFCSLKHWAFHWQPFGKSWRNRW
ncbi:MerR family DNA-binding transcriptional regulator [Pediococcus acidilactici]|uniref:MerR family DNA-binding transcriptional regulator n=1 Tax=Pediococcus acidilactici TaxID=1254 RepID=UPI001E37EF9E|nr:MerR family DNA-binding transcriptional regulator [Pediococcus acidilactici]